MKCARILPLLMALCLMCSAALASSDDDWLAGLREQLASPETTEVPFNGAVLLPGHEAFKEVNGTTSVGTKTATVPGNPDLLRSQIVGIRFESSQDGAPEDAWDMSAAGDRSVVGWAIPLGDDLYALKIAGNGRVRANPDADMLFAFYSSLISLDFNDSFDTVGVTSMNNMFYASFPEGSDAEVDFSCFDTSSVVHMGGMFSVCGLRHLDIATFDTSNVTNMGDMFMGNNSLKTLDINGWDVSNVENTVYMFADCAALETLDLSAWDLSNVENAESMFSLCPSLTTLTIGALNPDAYNEEYLFFGCDKLQWPVFLSGGDPFDASSPCLPDPHYFFHEKLKHTEKGTGDRLIKFEFHRDTAKAAKEYIDLLSSDSRFNLKLRATATPYKARDGVTVTFYLFDYTGNAEVDDTAGKSYLADETYTAPVIVQTTDWPASVYKGEFWIEIYCSSDFTFIETEDRSSIKAYIDMLNPGTFGPVGSAADSTPIPNKSDVQITVMPIITVAPQQCSICYGTGWRTCMSCSGTGRNCPNSFCLGGKVSCTTCGGTGWRR